MFSLFCGEGWGAGVGCLPGLAVKGGMSGVGCFLGFTVKVWGAGVGCFPGLAVMGGGRCRMFSWFSCEGWDVRCRMFSWFSSDWWGQV